MDVAGEGGCDWMGAAGKKVGDVNLVHTKKKRKETGIIFGKKMKRNGNLLSSIQLRCEA